MRALVMIAVGITASTVSGNILINGGFEATPVPTQPTWYFVGSDLGGWWVDGDQPIDHVSCNWGPEGPPTGAREGDKFLILGPGRAHIFQGVDLEPGSTYELTLYLGGAHETGTCRLEVLSEPADAPLDTYLVGETTIDTDGYYGLGWREVAYTFTARAGYEWLSLHGSGVSGSGLMVVDGIELTFVPAPPPITITGWQSIRTHTGSLGGQIDFAIDLDPVASNWDVKAEPRQGGIQWIRVNFNQWAEVVGPLEARDANLGTAYPVTSSSLSPDGLTLDMKWEPGLPDAVCYVIDLAGAIVSVGGLELDQDTDCMIRGLVGDTTDDGSTNNTDKSQVAAHNGVGVDATTAYLDVNLDGSINNTDKSLVASLNGHGVTCP